MSMKSIKQMLVAIALSVCFSAHSDELWQHILVSDYILFGTLNTITGGSSENTQGTSGAKYTIANYSYVSTDPRLPHLGDEVEIIFSHETDLEAAIDLLGKRVVIFVALSTYSNSTDVLYTSYWPFSGNIRLDSDHLLRSRIEQELREIKKNQDYSKKLSCHNEAAKAAVDRLVSTLKKGGDISDDYAQIYKLGKDVIPFLIYHINDSDAVPPHISFPAFNRNESYRIYSPIVIGNSMNVVLEDLAKVYFRETHNGGSEMSRDQAAKAWNYFLYKTSSEYKYCVTN